MHRLGARPTCACVFLVILAKPVMLHFEMCTINVRRIGLSVCRKNVWMCSHLLLQPCRLNPQQVSLYLPQVLSCSLEKLSSPFLPCRLVFLSLSHTIQLMAEHTCRDFSTPLWTPLLVGSLSLIVCWNYSRCVCWALFVPSIT